MAEPEGMLCHSHMCTVPSCSQRFYFCWLLSFSSVANDMFQAAFHSRYYMKKQEVEAQKIFLVCGLTSQQIVRTEIDI